MTSQLVEKDQRPWDARLLERMSRGASTAGGDNESSKAGSVILAMTHTFIAAATGAVTGLPILAALVLIYPLTLAGKYLWTRSKKKRIGDRSAGATPNPFGQ